MRHPVVFQKRALTIRYLEHEGTCHAQDFLSRQPHIKTKFLAIATELGEFGRIARRKRGHMLKGPYAGIMELKPGAGRVFGFREGRDFYVTNAAMKAKPKVQERDYQLAQQMRDNFLATRDKAR